MERCRTPRCSDRVRERRRRQPTAIVVVRWPATRRESDRTDSSVARGIGVANPRSSATLPIRNGTASTGVRECAPRRDHEEEYSQDKYEEAVLCRRRERRADGSATRNEPSRYHGASDRQPIPSDIRAVRRSLRCADVVRNTTSRHDRGAEVAIQAGIRCAGSMASQWRRERATTVE